MEKPQDKEVASYPGQTQDEPINQFSEWTLRSSLTLAGAFMAAFVTAGFLNAFGVFQDYYSNVVLSQYSSFDISWLGSFSQFILFSFGLVAGWMSDKYGPTIPMAGGAIAILVAVFMVSLCTEYYQFFLAQGLLLGLGMSFVTMPATGTVTKYFTKYRGTATGILMSGSSFGGVIWPILFDQLFNHDNVSFVWSFRIAGFMMIPLLAFAVIFVRAPSKLIITTNPESASEKSVTTEPDFSRSNGNQANTLNALRQPPFVLLCTGLFLFDLGYFTPIYYVSVYAEHLGFNADLALYMVSIINAASLLGRILPGFWADRFGRFNLITISAFAAAVVAFCWSSATSVAGLIVFAIAYGFTSGSLLSLQFACATMLADKDSAGVVVGTTTTSISLAFLVGPPIAGEILPHGYVALTCYTGATLLAGAVFLLLSRLSLNRAILAKI